MTGTLPAILALPFLLALMPALLPSAARGRGVALAGLWMALATLLVAVWGAGAHGTAAASGPWRDDGLSRALSVLPAVAWLLTALLAAIRPGGGTMARWSRRPIATQLCVAGAMLMCRVELLALAPPGFALLLWALARLEARSWRDAAFGLASLLAPLLLMQAGILLLGIGLGEAAGWTALSAHAAAMPRATLLTGTALLVLPAILLAAWSALRPGLPGSTPAGRDAADRVPASLLLAPPVFGLVLRAASLLDSPAGPIALALGLGWIVLSAGLLPACRTLRPRVSLAASVLLGAAMVGIGAGGSGGVAGGLMLLAVVALLLPLALATPAGPVASRLRLGVIAALVGLPPFASFAALLLLALRLFALQPLLALVVLCAVGFSAASVVQAMRRDGPAEGGSHQTAWVLGGVAALVVSGWFGLAMPVAWSDWLLALGGTGP